MKKLLPGVAMQKKIAMPRTKNFLYCFPIIITQMMTCNKAIAQDYIISAKQKWVNTGIDLNKGQKFSVSSRGSWTNGGANPQLVGPSGWPTVLLNSTLAPNLPLSSLIGRVDNSAFLIGEDYTGASPVDGRLYFSMNDDDFTDNDGQLKVSVTVKPWFVIIPDGKNNGPLVLIPKFFPYKIELNTIDPGTYDQDNNIWVQTYPMPPGRSEVKFKYTLKNKINTKPGKITAMLSGIKLLSSALFPNTITEMPANANFSGEFHCSGLPPGNYELRFTYSTKGSARRLTKSGQWEYVDSTLAEELYYYEVIQDLVDTDQDGLDDREEQRLLEKFRPYYKFSKQNGNADNYRPADVLWYIKQSELLTTEQESESPIIPNNVLSSNTSAIIFNQPEGKGSDIKFNAISTQYHVNPLNDGPGREGADWSSVMYYKNIGLYGHVVPIKLEANNGVLKYDRFKIPNGYDVGDSFLKIEYWQFFGFNDGNNGDAGMHEGDWITVQLIYNPRSAAVESVFYYEHGKLEIRFDMFGSKGPFPVSYPGVPERFAEYQGYNYGGPCYADVGAINTDWISKNCSNIAIRFCEDPVTRQFTHPVVYIENGGHEPWPMWTGYFAGVSNHNGDDYEHSFLTSTPPNLGEVESPSLNTPGAFEIIRFNGSWGAKNGGARGPSLHKQWTWPASSSIRWLIKADNLVD